MEIEDECGLSLELYNDRVLGKPEIGNSAGQAAGRSDFVISPSVANQKFSSRLNAWIETWSRLTAARNPILIALINKPPARTARPLLN
jgi:hypothetical protein